MNYLVDTHILLWAFIEPKRLHRRISEILTDRANNIYYSPVNLWEISIKYGIKKLELKGITPEDFFNELSDSFFLCKEINPGNMATNYLLPMHHRDPFDRFIIWEAIKNGFTLLSADNSLEPYRKEGLQIITNERLTPITGQ